MAVNILCTTFRRLAIGQQCNIIARHCSMRLSNDQTSILPAFLNFPDNPSLNYPAEHIKFASRTLNIDYGIPAQNSIIKNIIESPFKYVPSMEEPLRQQVPQPDIPFSDKSLNLPPNEDVVEKLAVRMIKIRRQKMKKHKRKKWLKKMEKELAKQRQRRSLKREKEFQALITAQMKKAEAFDAKEYVASRLALLDKERLPKMYRGEVLPPDMIRKFLNEKKAKEEAKRNKIRLPRD